MPPEEIDFYISYRYTRWQALRKSLIARPELTRGSVAGKVMRTVIRTRTSHRVSLGRCKRKRREKGNQ